MSYCPKILIADDEPRFCESLRLLLDGHGYDIHTSTSGGEAQQLLLRHEFDMALLDLAIPDVNGLQLMDYINIHCPDTSVVVITGNSSLDAAVSALRKGAYDYIRKPFAYEELLTTIQNALSQKKLELEKEEIHKKLELSEDRYRYLIQNSPDIIYTLDCKGCFTFVSNSAKRIIGVESEYLIGKHYEYIIHPDDLQKAKWTFNERRTGDRAGSWTELRLKSFMDDEEEEEITCEVKNICIELKCTGMYEKQTAGTPTFVGTHGVARDISNRKRLETQLQQAQKLESLGTLAGGIAHDFNNLLMVIRGHVSLMFMENNCSHLNHERLNKIDDCVQSAAALTNQLLGFARGGKYHTQPINLNSVLRQTSQMFGRTKKEIVIQDQYEKKIWPVEADQGQIEQVLLNLYVNAFHAMPAGGRLMLETENVSLGKSSEKPFNLAPGNYVKLSVSDTGIGMDEKTQQRIFEPFFTTKAMGRGTGLGLASAYGIIKNHKGMIEVKSKVGVGTCFIIYLPASEQEVTHNEAAYDSILKGIETVLLVDDEDRILDVERDLLSSLGYTVFVATSGKQAIELFETKPDEIDIVVLDMIMPEMGGGEIYDALRKIRPDVKVLLCSGYSEGGQASEILERGCTGFIQKPFNASELSEKLREIIDKSD
ncbi:MAG: response regulator [Deltaproteobacteria bacterium]|nr:response regulator [Deltaproteobacteria bacterium]